MPFENSVQDVMHPLSSYVSIDEDDSVEHALMRMADAVKEKKPPYLIVVGSDDQDKTVIKGFVTPPEIVFGMADHFLKGAESIGPIFWDGQLDSECREALQKQVREIMTPIKACINGAEKLMEAIFLLNTYQLRFLPVVRSEEVIGIIHMEDILTEIIHLASKKKA